MSSLLYVTAPPCMNFYETICLQGLWIWIYIYFIFTVAAIITYYFVTSFTTFLYVHDHGNAFTWYYDASICCLIYNSFSPPFFLSFVIFYSLWLFLFNVNFECCLLNLLFISFLSLFLSIGPERLPAAATVVFSSSNKGWQEDLCYALLLWLTTSVLLLISGCKFLDSQLINLVCPMFLSCIFPFLWE